LDRRNSGQSQSFTRVTFMLSPADNVGEGIMFLGRPVAPFVRAFMRSSSQILFTRYLMNGSNNFDKTDRKHSLAPAWRSKVEVTAGVTMW